MQRVEPNGFMVPSYHIRKSRKKKRAWWRAPKQYKIGASTLTLLPEYSQKVTDVPAVVTVTTADLKPVGPLGSLFQEIGEMLVLL